MRRILLTYILLVVGLLTAQAQFNPTQQVDPRTGRDANGNQIDPAMRVQEDSTDVEIQGLPPDTLYVALSAKTWGRFKESRLIPQPTCFRTPTW